MGIVAKKITKTVSHNSKTTVWAQLTPLKEHKKRETEGLRAEIVPTGSRKEPLPITRATTDLRKVYPYIFDCAAYAKTHNPEKIETDEFYSRFSMPYHVFLNYCLDDCTEQTDYLKNEIYKLMKGQPAKYIKVSKTRSVFGPPVVIIFSHTDLETGKDKRITNIGQDAKVNMVQVLILKELLDVSGGWINLPKSFYAKVRSIYNSISGMFEVKDNYPELIKRVKSCYKAADRHEAARFAQIIISQAEDLETFDPEQGGFYKIYLAYEYILANKKNGILSQRYDFIKLCEKCAPEFTQTVNGKLYLKRNKEALGYGVFINSFLIMLPEKERRIIGIKKISVSLDGKEAAVDFFNSK
jgi:hypothetical protein